MLVAGILAGCSAGQDDLPAAPIQPSVTSSEVTGYRAPEVNSADAVATADDEETQLEAAREAIGITQEQLEQTMAEQAGKYAYETMDESYRLLYAELLLIMQKQGENIKVSTNDSDILQYVFQCVYNDHPEIYWVDGYSYVRHTRGDEILYLTFTGKYTYSLEEIRVNQIYIDQYKATCFAYIPNNASEYEKVKHVYEYIIENTDYVISARDNQNILSVFLYGESVCQGYAKATQYLLNELGVACTMVVGRVHSGEGHAWNLVQIDGAYYYVDTTWGDASYIIEGEAASEAAMPVSYEYLNITTEQLQLTHVIENVVPMPHCMETANNYYVRENLYLTAYDTAVLGNMFDTAYAEGADSVTFKCADSNVFSFVCDELIGNQQIFNFLHSETTSVVYSVSEEQLTLSFWL